jgi:hypothetical protein
MCKVVVACVFDIHINTIVEVVNGPPCISHVKIPLGTFIVKGAKEVIDNA